LKAEKYAAGRVFAYMWLGQAMAAAIATREHRRDSINDIEPALRLTDFLTLSFQRRVRCTTILQPLVDCSAN
jgi:hypothetical protein